MPRSGSPGQLFCRRWLPLVAACTVCLPWAVSVACADAAYAQTGSLQAQVQAAARGGTKNTEAHQQYLQGKFFANQFSSENLAKAVGFFRRAVELDPIAPGALLALGDLSCNRGSSMRRRPTTGGRWSSGRTPAAASSSWRWPGRGCGPGSA